MIIKKGVWVLASLLIIVIFAFSFSSIKKQIAMKEIKDIQTEEKKKEPEKEAAEDNNPADQEVTAEEKNSDDPVREFLSEKVDKAAAHFFKKDIKMVAIGDSLTQGIGDETGSAGYVGILEDTINQDKDLVELKNFGKRGNRTDQMIKRMKDPEISEALKEADIILITIGANDIMQVFKENFTDLQMDQFTTEKANYENRLHYIFSEMEKNNSKADIYLIGFYNPFEEYFDDIEELDEIVNSWNSLSKDITNDYNQVSYIPIKDLFEDTSIDYFSDDNFHPNHLGYELMAERILEFIVNKGESDEDTE